MFTDNYYYLCTDIDNDGNSKIVASLQIEGNEDLVNKIRKEGRKENFIAIPVTESTNGIVSEVRSRGGRIGGYNANAKRFDTGSRGDASVSLGQQTNSRTSTQKVGRNSTASSKGAAFREKIAKHIDNLAKCNKSPFVTEAIANGGSLEAFLNGEYSESSPELNERINDISKLLQNGRRKNLQVYSGVELGKATVAKEGQEQSRENVRREAQDEGNSGTRQETDELVQESEIPSEVTEGDRGQVPLL